ncbi:MAG: phage protein Gp36 family protein [Burkholderia sp.]
MSYATLADMQARFPERDLRAVTDENNQAIDPVRVQRALDDASAEIDGYLAMRYTLPLVDVVLLTPLATPAVLVRACCDIAMYDMQTLRPLSDIKDARQRYEDCLKMLTLMGRGDVQIIGAQLRNGQATEPKDASLSPGATMIVSSRQHDIFGRRHR